MLFRGLRAGSLPRAENGAEAAGIQGKSPPRGRPEKRRRATVAGVHTVPRTGDAAPSPRRERVDTRGSASSRSRSLPGRDLQCPRAGFRRGCCRRRRLPAAPSRSRERPGPRASQHPVDPVVRCTGNVRTGSRRPASDDLLRRGRTAPTSAIPGREPQRGDHLQPQYRRQGADHRGGASSALRRRAVRSDSNSGTHRLGLEPAPETSTPASRSAPPATPAANSVVNGGSLAAGLRCRRRGRNIFDNAATLRGGRTLDRRRHQHGHQPGRARSRDRSWPSTRHRRRPEPVDNSGEMQRPQDHRQRQQRDGQPRGGHDPVDLHRHRRRRGTSSSTGAR